jgi:hypothetical protein
MADQNKEKGQDAGESRPDKPVVMDAIRHVGPTLEAEGIFLPTGELPENRIEAEGLTEAVDVRAVGEDEYDREADAMGAERLQTRLPGDTSSDPHTDTVADNAATMDTDRKRRKGRAA